MNAATSSSTTSTDGTTIAFDRVGEGPALVLVDGALCDRSSGPNGALAEQLADRFTVFTYDRRGRGESSDTAPYAVEREIEDLDAMIAITGGRAFVYGISSGAALSLEAAARGVAIAKLALFEAPFVVDDSRRPMPEDFEAHLDELISLERRGEAVHYFMTKGVGLPAAMVWAMRLMPSWRRLKKVAHTLPYDAAILGENGLGRSLSTERWSSLSVPILVVSGGKSPDWTQASMKALAEAVPGARHSTLEGQTHIVKAAALAPVLAEFFGENGGAGNALPGDRKASVA
jgi:pimeloyl-ACP methyl ester carboxylesterase